MIFHFVFSKNLQTPSFPVNLMSIKDVHHCDPNNARANLVRLHPVRKTNHGSEWSYSSHTCFEKTERANSIQFMDSSTAIAGCSESSQFPTHPREETKRINMRWDIGSTTRKFSKAPLNENQCEHTWLAIMYTSRHQWMFHHHQILLVRNTKYFSLLSYILITILSFVDLCSLSHGPPTCPWHLYSFRSLCRLCISEWRFHSWHVGGVLACPNRRLICWKSGCSTGP